MPAAWRKNGAKFDLVPYTDDADRVPLKIQTAQKKVAALLKELRSDGIILQQDMSGRTLKSSDVTYVLLPRRPAG